ncbi:MAG TPA: hypothetical protein VN719_09780 [Gemmatimonadales bacterium]|nr:hypothetical protein [Gemmatimonadales bacterium]
MVLSAPLAAQNRVGINGTTDLQRATNAGALGTLTGAATVSVGKVQGAWVQVTLNGWIIRSSVSPTTRDGFDLSVTPADGENLRAEPNGTVIAQLRHGTLLEKIGTRGGWLHVKRTGWVRRRSLDAPIETGALAERQAPAAPRQSTRSPAAARSKPPAPSTSPAPSKPAAPSQSPAASPSPATSQLATARTASPSGAGNWSGAEQRVEVARSATLAVTPEGGKLGTIEPGTDARVIGKAGDWVRVQVEGWVHEDDIKPSAQGALMGVSAAEVRAEPQRFVGQTVEWRVQFIAIQQADELRPELPAGRPFLLTRGPLPEPGFVYVILPRDQTARFQALPPLQEIVLRVTIRAPRTKYLATPVVELVGVVSGVADASRQP